MKGRSKAAAAFLFGSLVFLYLHLFILPRTPIYRVSDGLIYLQNAAKMFEGQVIYRDFFQFSPPATELVYFALFNLFGMRAWIPNALLLLLGVGFAWLSLVISRQLMRGAAAMLPGVLFLTLSYRFWPDGTHHWYSALAVMGATAVVMKERNPARMAVAGALCGFASCFTQIRGLAALLGLAAFLAWEHKQKGQDRQSLFKNEGAVFGAFFATVATFNAYFIWKAGLRRFLDCTVVFAVRYYPANAAGASWRVYFADTPGLDLSYPNLLPWGGYLFIHALLPLVYLLFFARYRRERRDRPEERWNELVLLNTVGFALFLAIAPAPGWLRLCSVSLPALILLVWLINSSGRIHRAMSRFLWASVMMLAAFEVWTQQNHWRAFLDVPPGRTAFLELGDYELHQWILERTHPSEFMFEAVFPRMYFSLGLQNPATVPFLTNTDYTRPDQVLDVVESLERHQVRFVLWSNWLDVPAGPDRSGDHLEPLRAYLKAHYRVIKMFGGSDEVWERQP